ncbi:MAG TPA: radical SAM protein [bacterium]|nr:radical SAM protein [bacterium]
MLLLTSVFRPFGVDDEYGRKENKLELFHNQVTREQGLFSIRSNHRSFGLYFIAENLKTPTVVLDFPTLKQFRKEVRKGYEHIGISFILPNFAKAKKMAEIIREESPKTKIILGGHGTAMPGIENMIDCDYVMKGEGISKLREFFGEDVNAPIKHPAMPGSDHKRILGFPLPQMNAVVIPGVGCPNACRFCCTSHFFEKTYYPFLKTGREMYDTLEQLSKELKTKDFFIMDENFLKHKERAMELLEIIEREGKDYNFSIFSSAEALVDFGIENIVRLGVIYIWIGVESKKMLFEKTQGIDVQKLIDELRSNGIIVLASSILFLEHHNKETIHEDIDYAISMAPDFTQFMQLGPSPISKLYTDYKEEGKLLEDMPYEEWHGQKRINFRHPEFTQDESEEYLVNAFRKEYETLGPSILRSAETMVRGLDSPFLTENSAFMNKRYLGLKKKCAGIYYTLTAMKWLSPTVRMKRQADRVISMYKKQFGPRTPLHWISNAVVYLGGLYADLKLKTGHEAHQPGTLKTFFRVSPATYKEMMKNRIEVILKRKRTLAVLDRSGATAVLSLHLAGKINMKKTELLARKFSRLKNINIKSISINISPMASVRADALKLLQEKLALALKCKNIRVNYLEA